METANSGKRPSPMPIMKSPLTAPAVPEVSTAADTVAFERVRAPARRRWIRIAAWAVLIVAALAGLAAAGLRLLVLPWPMAVLLGVTLAGALALLAVGLLLIVLAVRGR
jgi:hypothetical protein